MKWKKLQNCFCINFRTLHILWEQKLNLSTFEEGENPRKKYWGKSHISILKMCYQCQPVWLQNVGSHFHWINFQNTQRTLTRWKYYKILFCLHMNLSLKFCMCIWITWNNFKQMLKSFNDCLFVLKIVEYLKIVNFLPPTLLKLEILCWKQMEFV